MRTAEVEKNGLQVLLGSGADGEATELRRAGRIDVANLYVGAHLVVEQEADGRDGGETIEEGSGFDLGGSLREGGALLFRLGDGCVLHLLAPRDLSAVGEFSGIALSDRRRL